MNDRVDGTTGSHVNDRVDGTTGSHVNDRIDSTISSCVRALAASQPDQAAFIDGLTGETVSWSTYDRWGDVVAAAAVHANWARGDRVAVCMRDGARVHAVFLGLERAGIVAVGIGARAGEAEIRHLVSQTGARAIISDGTADVGRSHAVGVDIPWVAIDELDFDLAPRATPEMLRDRSFAAYELSFLNSTSGTTGLPKCVMHHQGRWFAFHELAAASGRFADDDVFMSCLPAPFGFGLWTAHFTPTIMGRPCVVFERFDPDAALAAIARHRVTVLGCVSTQFIMMLGSRGLDDHDLSSLRCMYTGGEAVPFAKAAEFEDRTGCTVLQFYGSNETGALSCTSLDDPRDERLRTAGRLIAEMQVRLFDESGNDVTSTGGPAIPACKGRVNCLGYYNDDAANARLYTADGWMLMGDLVTIEPPGDPHGVLRVVGRTSDFIIRGGKNISAPKVEEEVATHPAIALVAAVAMPDRVFGERVCVYVVPRRGQPPPTLAELGEHLASRGVGKELWPERIEIVPDDLPRSSGGKVAKAALRADIASKVSGD